MQPAIHSYNPNAEFYTVELCFINELSNYADDPDVSIARARVRPNVTTHWHKLAGIVERYVILEGEAVVEIGDLPAKKVKPNDVAIIPSGCRQRITNIGNTDLVFLAICSPRFVQEAYEDLEDVPPL
jgi:mannose-6-phosphate isomerase-like protein (cupin superfamily)